MLHLDRPRVGGCELQRGSSTERRHRARQPPASVVDIPLEQRDGAGHDARESGEDFDADDFQDLD